MPFENKRLLEFLEEMDQQLETSITLTAVGGTAMTLLNLKSSTIDIDFEFSTNQEKQAFEKAEAALGHGYKIDKFVNGLIFSQQLPGDFRKTTKFISTKFKHIRLFALHPLDIVVTKIGRMSERDVEDISDCVKKYKLTKQQVKQRAGKIYYIGNPKNYQHNLEIALKKFFQ